LAWRMSVKELLSALEDERGEGERAATFVLSPLGARASRVLLAGTVAPAESVGRSESTPFLRSRFTDPTGTAPVTAGSFTPRALAHLQRVRMPTSAIVVGKPHLFRGRDGTVYPSVRLEALRPVDPADLASHWRDIARATLDRMALQRLVRSTEALDAAALAARGFPPAWLGAARRAAERYPGIAPETFRPTVEILLRAPTTPLQPQAEAAVRVTPVAPPSDPGRARPAVRDPIQISALLSIVDELAGASTDGYADLSEAIVRAQGRGIPGPEVEELVNRLEEEGELEEPLVGKLRRP
jgi:uncharacterized protein